MKRLLLLLPLAACGGLDGSDAAELAKRCPGTVTVTVSAGGLAGTGMTVECRYNNEGESDE